MLSHPFSIIRREYYDDIYLTLVIFVVTSAATIPLGMMLIRRRSSSSTGSLFVRSFIYHILHIIGVALTWVFLVAFLRGSGILVGGFRYSTTEVYLHSVIFPTGEVVYGFHSQFLVVASAILYSYLTFLCFCYLVCRKLSQLVVRDMNSTKKERTRVARGLVLVVLLPHGTIVIGVLVYLAWRISSVPIY